MTHDRSPHHCRRLPQKQDTETQQAAARWQDKWAYRHILQGTHWWTIKHNGNWRERHRVKGNTANRKYGHSM